MARATAVEKKHDKNAELASDRAKRVQDSQVTAPEGSAEPSPVWAKLVSDRNGASPFVGRQFLADVASGRAGVSPLPGEWPDTGPSEWRRAAGVTALNVAYTMQVPEELVLAWEAGEEPCADNWRGGHGLDDHSVKRLYAAFRGYADAGPWPEPKATEPPPARPALRVIGGEGFPRPELLEAANLGYEVPVASLGGEGRFLRVVVRGEVAAIPALEAVPAGAELRRLREAFNYSPEGLGSLLGAAASRVLAWEDEIALPGVDCDFGLPAALRPYAVFALVDADPARVATTLEARESVAKRQHEAEIAEAKSRAAATQAAALHAKREADAAEAAVSALSA